MSDENLTRAYSFTVRLSPDEKATLVSLSERFHLDKSATVRKALQLTLANGRQTLAKTGCFVPLLTHELAFLVRLSGEDADGG